MIGNNFNARWFVVLCLNVLIPFSSLAVETNTNWRARFQIPEDFPKFSVPGHEREMEDLREMHWLHFSQAEGSTIFTLWTEWLTGPMLWPAWNGDHKRNVLAAQFDKQYMSDEGYLGTHVPQPSQDGGEGSIAYNLSWVFPVWTNSNGGYGWHFSFKNTGDPLWHPKNLSATNGWAFTGVRDDGLSEDGWNITLLEPNVTATPPPREIDTRQSPFVQLRWFAKDLGNAQCFLEWTTKAEPQFDASKRMYFNPAHGTNRNSVMIPVFRHPKWTNTVTQMRIHFANAATNIPMTIQAFFTQYDTRHNINNPNFVRGCIHYFYWTHDLNFLRRNLQRVRMALRFEMDEMQTLKYNCVYTPWVGHEGTTGVKRLPDGSKQIVPGSGIDNNYWDIIPFGGWDCYATIEYYSAVKQMAALEREIQEHPEWNLPGGPLRLDANMLEQHAVRVKKEGNRRFWNKKTGRFFAAIDVTGEGHDYGFTSLNLNAVYYDFATPEHAEQIERWITGEREVPGDTSKGADIYHFRFAPRTTTKRNTGYYGFFWPRPETIPWSTQVQDGGAVFGWSYHDLMDRLKLRGADNATKRLDEILTWFEEAQAAGGYRAYYAKLREVALQGDNIGGGLGIDREFFESLLVPQLVLDGFLGFTPTCDGCRIQPHLPSDWPELTVDRIRLHDLILKVKATPQTVEIWKEGATDLPFFVQLPDLKFSRMIYLSSNGTELRRETPLKRKSDGAIEIKWAQAGGVRFSKEK